MKKINYTLVFILFTGNILLSFSQKQDSWESYVVQKDKGIMHVSVNMELNFAKPNYKNLLLVGTSTTKCLKNGYPTTEGLEELFVFSDSIATIIDGSTKNRLAGIITYQCSGFDVFYVKDTLNLRESISKLLDSSFSRSKNYLVVNNDKKWEYYKNVLYPKNVEEDFFINQDLLRQLVEEGDDLSQPKELKHWVYFTSDRRRTKFINKIKTLEFKIDSVNFKKDKKFIDEMNSFYYSRVRNYPYEIKISRKDSINPESISQLTKMLKMIVRTSSGKYDGWGLE